MRPSLSGDDFVEAAAPARSAVATLAASVAATGSERSGTTVWAKDAGTLRHKQMQLRASRTRTTLRLLFIDFSLRKTNPTNVKLWMTDEFHLNEMLHLCETAVVAGRLG